MVRDLEPWRVWGGKEFSVLFEDSADSVWVDGLESWQLGCLVHSYNYSPAGGPADAHTQQLGGGGGLPHLTLPEPTCVELYLSGPQTP